MFCPCVGHMLASMTGSDPRADRAAVELERPERERVASTGTVTLLLADVEGLHAAVAGQPEAMTAAVAALDRTLCDVVARYDGVRPSSRARATASSSRSHGPVTPSHAPWHCNGRRSLRSECGSVCTPVRCSCAMKALLGPTINRAARLRDLAHGGQTVLSARPTISSPTSCPTRCGCSRSRHVTPCATYLGPERVMQLCHPDLRNEFPPLRTGKKKRCNAFLPNSPASSAVAHRSATCTGWSPPSGC